MSKNIAERVFQNPCYVQDEYYKLIKPKKDYTKYKGYKYKRNLKDISKMSGIDVLFVFYISQTEKDIENVTNLRQKYRNKLRIA